MHACKQTQLSTWQIMDDEKFCNNIVRAQHECLFMTSSVEFLAKTWKRRAWQHAAKSKNMFKYTVTMYSILLSRTARVSIISSGQRRLHPGHDDEHAVPRWRRYKPRQHDLLRTPPTLIKNGKSLQRPKRRTIQITTKIQCQKRRIRGSMLNLLLKSEVRWSCA